ncbi:MAG TPA: trypsin-like peptidase domain-containing protein [Usitatibacter sp.]|nr:trypsin-like peptidase domain-containing protein [Usitatibacter sp.]
MQTRQAHVLAAALALAVLTLLAPAADARGPTPAPRAVAPRGPLGAAEQAVVKLFEEAAPSVAYINTERVALGGFFGPQVYQGAGSGFVWDEGGHIVTNYHVVEDARSVRVQLGSETYAAKVVGVAPDYDLAVVKLAKVPRGLKPIRIGTSADLKIGQSVYAIGNPFGLTRTLTSGIVSALDRHLPTTEVLEVSGVIQTDAAINPGNSGGPLLDSAGRLIGVTSAIKSPVGASSGVGLAIPVDLVNRIVPQLIAHGRALLPSIGIVPVDPDLVASAGIKGVVIARVQQGSPAARAGLKPFDPRSGDLGDVIVAVDGHAVASLPEFGAELDRAGIDREADLTVVRGGKPRHVRVKIVAVER